MLADDRGVKVSGVAGAVADNVEILRPDSRADVLLICDHAQALVPESYGNLGLQPADFGRHIAYDIGAAWLTRALSEHLDAPAILSPYSRLLVDCNRTPEAPSFIPEESDGIAVPGNCNIGAGEHDLRKRLYFDPYHQAIEAHLRQTLAAGTVPLVLSIHSYTPIADGLDRSKAISLLWDQDRRASDLMLPALRSVDRFEIGENVPYDGSQPEGYGMQTYNRKWGLPFILFEVRQDILSDCALRLAVAETVAKATSTMTQSNHRYTLNPH